jgi:hypothetical protein
MGLTSCRWITIAKTLARRRSVVQPASCRLPCAVERYILICDGPVCEANNKSCLRLTTHRQ